MKKTYLFSNVIISLVLVSLTMLIYSINPISTTASTTPKPIYKGNTETSNVSLMINVYWGDEFLPSMLDTLDEYDVKTTFFFGGSWVAKNDTMLKDIYARGHEIANHGYLHKDQDKLDLDGNMREISVTQSLIEQTIGIRTDLFAPPSGAFNDFTLEASATLGHTTIMWSRDTIDWRDKNADLIYKRATKDIAGGDLILMHPTACTAEALPKILKFYAGNNLKCSKVSDVIKFS